MGRKDAEMLELGGGGIGKGIVGRGVLGTPEGRSPIL